MMAFEQDPAKNFERAIVTLKQQGLVKPGSHVVAVTEINIGGQLIDTILMETVE